MTPPPDAGNQPPKQSPRIIRRRSALKIDTPKPAPLSSSPPKQTADSISVNARSSSVVAPSRDGKAGMLFSRAELRLPMRTAPLSARSHGRSSSFGGVSAGSGRGSGRWSGAFLSTGSAGGGGDCGGDSGGGSGSSSACQARPSPSFATVREEEATKRCCFAASSSCPSTLSSLSPPRLAALDTTTRTRSRRASADGRLQMLTGVPHRGATATTPTATAAATATTVSTTKSLGKGVNLVHGGGGGGAPSPADSCGSTPAPSPESTVYPTEEEYSGGSERPVSVSRHSLVVMPSLIEMPALIDPAVGEADYLADYARGQGHGTTGRRSSQQGKNAQDLGTGGGGVLAFEGEALGSARSSSGRGTGSGGERRTWGRKSRGGGGVRGHTGMSVAEFADKVAALAADVAGVFGMSGRKTISPPAVPCGLQQPGVE